MSYPPTAVCWVLVRQKLLFSYMELPVVVNQLYVSPTINQQLCLLSHRESSQVDNSVMKVQPCMRYIVSLEQTTVSNVSFETEQRCIVGELP